MLPFVAVVVLNWNQRALTMDCLASLATVNHPTERLDLIVVDNGSTDGTTQAVRAHYPMVTVLQNTENLGYAAGNNVGIRYALDRGADYICIANNDVTTSPDFLAGLLAPFQDCRGLGVASPLVAETAEPGQVWALGSEVDWRTGAVSRLHVGEAVSAHRMSPAFEVDVASGAAMLVKRDAFERVGLLDEAFYLYFEETDWCLRVHNSGFRILAVPSSLVWHRGSATLGPSSPVIDYYMVRNHLRLIARHWSGLARARVLVRTVMRNLLTVAAYTAKPRGGQRLPHRNARLLALRDAMCGRWGKMGSEVAAVCCPRRP